MGGVDCAYPGCMKIITEALEAEMRRITDENRRLRTTQVARVVLTEGPPGAQTDRILTIKDIHWHPEGLVIWVR